MTLHAIELNFILFKFKLTNEETKLAKKKSACKLHVSISQNVGNINQPEKLAKKQKLHE
jgi:hypothetical protein